MKESEPVIGPGVGERCQLRCQPWNVSGTRDPQILPKNAPRLAFSFVSTPSFSPQLSTRQRCHVVPPFVRGCRTSPHCVAFDPAFPLREHDRMRASLVSSYLSFMSRPVLLYHSQTVFVLASRVSWPLSWPLLPFVHL